MVIEDFLALNQPTKKLVTLLDVRLASKSWFTVSKSHYQSIWQNQYFDTATTVAMSRSYPFIVTMPSLIKSWTLFQVLYVVVRCSDWNPCTRSDNAEGAETLREPISALYGLSSVKSCPIKVPDVDGHLRPVGRDCVNRLR